MMGRRRARWGNKEWAEYLISKLSVTEQAELRTLLAVSRSRLDVVWWLHRLLGVAT